MYKFGRRWLQLLAGGGQEKGERSTAGESSRDCSPQQSSEKMKL